MSAQLEAMSGIAPRLGKGQGESHKCIGSGVVGRGGQHSTGGSGERNGIPTREASRAGLWAWGLAQCRQVCCPAPLLPCSPSSPCEAWECSPGKPAAPWAGLAGSKVRLPRLGEEALTLNEEAADLSCPAICLI